MFNQPFKVIAFDADDTLWVNEPFYQETEKQFGELMLPYLEMETLSEELYKTEMQNIPIYGYGVKGFMHSMIETALRVTHNKIDPLIISKIIDLGKELLNKPIELLEGVPEVLDKLNERNIKMIVATKGDLLDQERKLDKSNLEHYFHHVEIMSEKNEQGYMKLISHLDIQPTDFLMIGNSIRSDIMPVLNINGYAIHVPFEITWVHENNARIEKNEKNFVVVDNLTEVIEVLGY
jgi:putative hydrolase of the HAD superfamily